MPKIVDHSARLHTIIEQSLDIFSRTGYYSASYERIAEQCGLSRTGLYKYFSNKDAIFIEVVRFVVDDVTERLQHIMQYSARPSGQRVKEVLDVFVHFMKNRRFSSILLEFTEEGDRYVSLLRRWEELSQRLFDEQQRASLALSTL